jgi:hypothetical protein
MSLVTKNLVPINIIISFGTPRAVDVETVVEHIDFADEVSLIFECREILCQGIDAACGYIASSPHGSMSTFA